MLTLTHSQVVLLSGQETSSGRNLRANLPALSRRPVNLLGRDFSQPSTPLPLGGTTKLINQGEALSSP
eukprot:2910334-Prorocentrum_lima.AAC.1